MHMPLFPLQHVPVGIRSALLARLTTSAFTVLPPTVTASMRMIEKSSTTH